MAGDPHVEACASCNRVAVQSQLSLSGSRRTSICMVFHRYETGGDL